MLTVLKESEMCHLLKRSLILGWLLLTSLVVWQGSLAVWSCNSNVFCSAFMSTWSYIICRGLSYLLFISSKDFLQMLQWHLKVWVVALFPGEFSFAHGCCYCSVPAHCLCVWFFTKHNTSAPWKRHSYEIKSQRFFFYLLDAEPLLYIFCTLAGASCLNISRMKCWLQCGSCCLGHRFLLSYCNCSGY